MRFLTRVTHHFVSPAIGSMCKLATTAVSTWVWFFAGVHTQMQIVPVFVWHFVIAMLTLVRELLCVNRLLMLFQLITEMKSCVTLITPVPAILLSRFGSESTFISK
uniref:Uncharacterized protein n=1 Tax=Anopheles culicifacies TaxID=139723 RepID=A0A182LW88_9DIPT